MIKVFIHDADDFNGHIYEAEIPLIPRVGDELCVVGIIKGVVTKIEWSIEPDDNDRFDVSIYVQRNANRH